MATRYDNKKKNRVSLEATKPLRVEHNGSVIVLHAPKPEHPDWEGWEALKEWSPLQPETLDLTPDSPHYHPIVDFHLFLHYVEDNPNVLQLYEETLRDKNLHNTAGLDTLGVKSAGLHVVNYLTARACLESEAKAKGLLPPDYGRHHRIGGSLRHDFHDSHFRILPDSPAAELASSFSERIGSRVEGMHKQPLTNLQQFATRYLRHFPRLLKALVPEQQQAMPAETEHMKLQERFNKQTRQTAEAHRTLDALLSGDLTNEDARHAFEDASAALDYDVSLFLAFEQEQDMFRQATLAMEFWPGSVEVERYKNLLTEARTVRDFNRALTLRHITEGVKEALAFYDTLVHDAIATESLKQLVAERYLQHVNLQYYIDRCCTEPHEYLARETISKRSPSFSAAYEEGREHFEKYTEFHADVKRWKKRYARAIASENPTFLLGAIESETLFEQRRQFGKKYGRFDDPEAAYRFVQQCHGEGPYGRLRAHLQPELIPKWMAIADEGVLNVVGDLHDAELRSLMEAVREKSDNAVQNAITILRFAETYGKIIDSLHANRGGKQRIHIPARKDVIQHKDYVTMKYFDDIVLDVEIERERRNFYAMLKPAVNVGETPIKALIEADTGFVEQNIDRLREIRQALVGSGRNDEYHACIDALYRASSGDERRRGFRALYHRVKQACSIGSPLDLSSTVLAQLAEEPTPVTPAEPIAPERFEQDDDRPHISHLVLLGARPGIDYGKRLEEAFDIGRISTIGAGEKRKAHGKDPSAVYIVLTDSCTHSVEDVIRGMPYVERSSTSGKQNLASAIQLVLSRR